MDIDELIDRVDGEFGFPVSISDVSERFGDLELDIGDDDTSVQVRDLLDEPGEPPKSPRAITESADDRTSVSESPESKERRDKTGEYFASGEMMRQFFIGHG